MYSVYKQITNEMARLTGRENGDLVHYGPDEQDAFAAARRYGGCVIREDDGAMWTPGHKWLALRAVEPPEHRREPELRIPRTPEEVERAISLRNVRFPEMDEAVEWAQVDMVIWKKITRVRAPWGEFYVGKLIDGRLLKAPSLPELRTAAIYYIGRLRRMPYLTLTAALWTA